MSLTSRVVQAPFLWGAATSAHQVEGDNLHNDWWAWEKNTPGVPRSGKACNHYKRYAEDFALARELGHTAHRLSLEWSRLELVEGQWNTGAVEHYRRVLEELRRQGLTSFVTLHHFTNPMWLTKQGGWLSTTTPRLFARYARFIAEQLGDLVDFWITINEPMVYAGQSYWRALWPPQQHSALRYWRVVRQLAHAHRQAYHAIHAVLPLASVGIAKNVLAIPPAKGGVVDALAAQIESWWYNHYFFQLTRGRHDFIGVNYYFRRGHTVSLWPPRRIPSRWVGPVSDMQWPIYPKGLTSVLLDMQRYGVPLYVTENGLADADDSRRADFIRSHLRALEEAQAQGADVRGYLHWSLLDNFEWADGFGPRFGLVHVNYETQQRTPRPSAFVYRAIIQQAR